MEQSDARRKTERDSRTRWLSALAALACVLVFPWSGKSSAESGTESTQQKTATLSIPVEGMSCGSCAASVTRAAKALDGVREVDVDLAGARARVEYAEGKVTPEAIAAAISGLGYKVGTPVMERNQ